MNSHTHPLSLFPASSCPLCPPSQGRGWGEEGEGSQGLQVGGAGAETAGRDSGSVALAGLSLRLAPVNGAPRW